jgi:hypothetical protein
MEGIPKMKNLTNPSLKQTERNTIMNHLLKGIFILYATLSITVSTSYGATNAEIAEAARIADVPPTGHPDLEIPVSAYGPEVLEAIREEIAKTQATAGIAASAVTVPDYQFVYQIFQIYAARAILDYFRGMEEIRVATSKFLSDLYGLQEAARQDPFFQQLVRGHLQKEVPATQKFIQTKYFNIIQQMYLLPEQMNALSMKSEYSLPAKTQIIDGYRKHICEYYMDDMYHKNALTEAEFHSSKLLALCKTAACAYKMRDHLKEWNAFVDAINVDISISNFRDRTFVNLANPSHSHGLSHAMALAAETLMKGIETNKEYHIASYLGALLKVPGGWAVSFARAPVVVLEKAGNFASRFLNLKILKVSLDLKKPRTYSLQAINRKLDEAIKTRSKQLPTAIFTEEETQEIRKSMRELVEAKIKSQLSNPPTVGSGGAAVANALNKTSKQYSSSTAGPLVIESYEQPRLREAQIHVQRANGFCSEFGMTAIVGLEGADESVVDDGGILQRLSCARLDFTQFATNSSGKADGQWVPQFLTRSQEFDPAKGVGYHITSPTLLFYDAKGHAYTTPLGTKFSTATSFSDYCKILDPNFPKTLVLEEKPLSKPILVPSHNTNRGNLEMTDRVAEKILCSQ